MDIRTLASGSSGNSYRISDGETALLIECGLPIRRIKDKLGYTLSQIQGCLISHEHHDHSMAAPDLIKAGIDVYTSLGTAQALGIHGSHRFIQLFPLKLAKCGTFNIIPFETEHDAAEPLGFQITSNVTDETLVFITDSYFTRYKFAQMDYLMIECNYDIQTLNERMEEGALHPRLRNRVRKSHMGLEQVLEVLRANDLSKLKKVYLLHLSDGNSNEERMKQAVQAITGVPVEVV